MIRLRLSTPARADIAAILRTSALDFGPDAGTRYRGLIAGALRRIAQDPEAVPTVGRGELGAGLRSLHLRHCRGHSREAPVARPVHVVFYRRRSPQIVEVVRVLHERMEPARHLPDGNDRRERPLPAGTRCSG